MSGGGGGVFDFADGGSYLGGWEEGRAHGLGLCKGPGGEGEYAGSWEHGFETLGVYSTPRGSSYLGQWSQGTRHGLGAEKREGPGCPQRWSYLGEWTQGHRGPLGVREAISGVRYEGSWSPSGQQNEYGTETYTDGGTYIGQWVNGKRHGFGVRQSAPYREAAVLHSPRRSSLNSVRSDKGPETSKTSKNSVPSPAVATAQLNNNGSAGRELEEPESIPSIPGVNFQTLRKTNQKKIENSEANNHNHTQESKPQSAGDPPISPKLSRPPPASLGASRAGFVLTQQLCSRSQPAGGGARKGAGPADGGRGGAAEKRHFFSRKGRSLSATAENQLQQKEGNGRNKPGFFLRRTSLLSGLRLARRSESKNSLSSKRSSLRSANEGEGEGEEGGGKERTLLDSDRALFQVSDGSVTEVYSGEWRLDKRSGFGQSRRSDGLSYEGAWLGNRRHGYGRTVFPDGRCEEGKYRGNELTLGGPADGHGRAVTRLILLRQRSKVKGKVERAVLEARGAALIARQREELATARTVLARLKAEAALSAAEKALEASRLAKTVANQLAPILHDCDWNENKNPIDNPSLPAQTQHPQPGTPTTATPLSSLPASPCPQPLPNGLPSPSPSPSPSPPPGHRKDRVRRERRANESDRGKAGRERGEEPAEPGRSGRGHRNRHHHHHHHHHHQKGRGQRRPPLQTTPPREGEDEENLSSFEIEMRPLQPCLDCQDCGNGEDSAVRRERERKRGRRRGKARAEEDDVTSCFFFDCPQEVTSTAQPGLEERLSPLATTLANGEGLQERGEELEKTDRTANPIIVLIVFLLNIGLAYWFSQLFS